MSSIKDEARKEIESFILEKVENVITKRTETEPFVIEHFERESPFNSALVPKEIWIASKFERSFVTMMGQYIYEKIVEIIGKYSWGFSERNHHTRAFIYQEQITKIQNILSTLQHPNRNNNVGPNWTTECEDILSITSGNKTNIEVISDIYLLNAAENKQAFLELKAPKPNADQTKESKDKMFKLFCVNRESPYETYIYFALPYNPYLTRDRYNWPHPKRYFDMCNSPVVIMGKELWDFVGGEGTYEELVGLFQDIGIQTKQNILNRVINITY